jgi:hypothetical protein
MSQTKTGRLIPSAWPSKKMIQSSRYLQSIINKPVHTYISSLTMYSPLHMLALLFVGVSMVNFVKSLLRSRVEPRVTEINTNVDQVSSSGDTSGAAETLTSTTMNVLILSVWPLAFLVALTLLGFSGAGYQLRFLAPTLPALSVIAGQCISTYSVRGSSLVPVVAAVLTGYSAMHCLYYGVMFSPMYADLDGSVASVVFSLLTSPSYAPQDQYEMQNIFKYLAYHGLNRKVG